MFLFFHVFFMILFTFLFFLSSYVLSFFFNTPFLLTSPFFYVLSLFTSSSSSSSPLDAEDGVVLLRVKVLLQGDEIANLGDDVDLLDVDVVAELNEGEDPCDLLFGVTDTSPT